MAASSEELISGKKAASFTSSCWRCVWGETVGLPPTSTLWLSCERQGLGNEQARQMHGPSRPCPCPGGGGGGHPQKVKPGPEQGPRQTCSLDSAPEQEPGKGCLEVSAAS